MTEPTHPPTATGTISAPDLVARAESWMAADVDDADVAELRRLLVASEDDATGHLVLAELADRFAGPLQFGTAGRKSVV